MKKNKQICFFPVETAHSEEAAPTFSASSSEATLASDRPACFLGADRSSALRQEAVPREPAGDPETNPAVAPHSLPAKSQFSFAGRWLLCGCQTEASETCLSDGTH